eukprot:c16830_g1_i1 orf=456-2963(+)
MSLCFPAPHIAVDHSGIDCLRSSFFHSARFTPKFHPSILNPSASRQKYAIQSALPGIADSLYNGLDLNTHENIIKLQNVVLQGASQLGLSLPSQTATTWWWAVVAPVVLSYVFATPGSVAGLADFVVAPIHAQSFRSFSADDVEIGRQLGEGSFGVVYEGFFGRHKKGRKGEKSEGLHVVLKKAKTRVKGASEVHDSEIHMNYRLQRTASFACAEFLGTMQVKPAHAHGKLSEGVWLVWNFQGDRTLDYYLKQKNFPENLSAPVLGESMQVSSKEEVFKRNAGVIKAVFKQILSNLQHLHRSGVVHRDVKPLNLILDQNSGMFKLIDLGACVDLRSGFNYVPNETVIDPTYAAPEHYVMPTSTPSLPPDPLCSLVSPVLWHLNTPDRFDLYSAGLILMQLSMKSLRHDAGMQAFNTELKRNGYNLQSWRANCRHSKDEFAFLDADGGAGWELATALLQPRHDRDKLIWPSLGNSRPSASAALRHRFFNGSFVMPKLVPKEVQDPAVHVLPSFEGVAQKLSSAAKNVVNSSQNYLPGLKLEQLKENKANVKVSSYPSTPVIPPVSNVATSDKPNSGLKRANSIGLQHFVGNAGFPHLNPVSLSTSSILPSTTAMTEKLRHAIRGAFSERPVRVDGEKVDVVTRSPPTPEIKPLVEEEDSTLRQSSPKTSGAVFNSIGAAFPSVATSAITLATGWLVLSGLNSSAQASYELGKLLASSSGISGSAFLAFFLVIKPWLEEQDTSLGESKDSEPVESQEIIHLEKFKSIHSEHIKVQVVVEAVQELEMQMSSLEALVLEEQQLSGQHKALVQKMESLLLRPSTCQSSFQQAEHTSASRP